MSTSNVFSRILEEAGYRMTKQRRAVCDYLARTSEHPTASSAFAAISRQHPEISRATVYNTLNLLKQLGAITEISFGDDHVHYETDLNPHINLICLRCHKIIDYPQTLPLGDLYETLQQQTGFRPVVSKTEIFGFCQECREKRKEEIRLQWQSDHIAPSHDISPNPAEGDES
jgi:Fur family peroxide stress response transcriptional regulator